MSTLLITHPACLDHVTPMGHPERPDRLRAIERILENERFQTLAREQAPAAALETIALCHPMDYVESVRDATPKDVDPAVHAVETGAMARRAVAVAEDWLRAHLAAGRWPARNPDQNVAVLKAQVAACARGAGQASAWITMAACAIDLAYRERTIQEVERERLAEELRDRVRLA